MLFDAVIHDIGDRLGKGVIAARQARSKEDALLREGLAPLVRIVESDPKALAALDKLREARRVSRSVTQRRDTGPSRRYYDSPRAAASWAPIRPGELTVLGPPFDIPWTGRQGNEHGSRYADQTSGTFGFNTGPVTGDWTSLNAGIGLIVASPQIVTGYVTADASFDYAWADSASFVTSHTSGLVGTLIYDIDGGGSAEVAIDARHDLWSDGSAWLEEHSGSGEGLVQSYLYQISLAMIPGHRYLIWTWCGGESDGNLASCRLDAKLFALAIWASTQ